MLARLISWRHPVRRAVTPEERKAVFRLRYDVYVRELQKSNAGPVDHANGELHDPEDDRDESLLLFTGTSKAASATLRADAYDAAAIPQTIRERYRLDDLPALSGQPIFELCRFVVAAAFRRSPAVIAITTEMRRLITKRGLRFGFAYAAPGLVSAYRKFGFRPYSAPLLHTADGVRVPLLVITEPLSTVGLPDAGALGATEPPYDSDRRKVLEALRDLQALGSPVFQGVETGALRHVAPFAAVVRVRRGAQLLRAGLVDRELFVVLHGTLVARRGGRAIRRVGPGEPLGEVALFLDGGIRSADVFAEDDAVLLMLRRKAIDELIRRRPALGARLLRNLARVMAARMSSP